MQTQPNSSSREGLKSTFGEFCLVPRMYCLVGNNRIFLHKDTCHLVVRALILTRLDYGNALQFGSNSTDIQRLQRLQNWAAKLVCRTQKHDHTYKIFTGCRLERGYPSRSNIICIKSNALRPWRSGTIQMTYNVCILLC